MSSKKQVVTIRLAPDVIALLKNSGKPIDQTVENAVRAYYASPDSGEQRDEFFVERDYCNE